MSLKNEDLKKSTQINVTDSQTGEITKIVFTKDVQVGLTSSPKNLNVTGNSTFVSGTFNTLTVSGNSTFGGPVSGSAIFGSTSFVPIVAGGRLTLTSGVPVTTNNVVSGTTLYYTPHESGQITLFNGTSWQLCSFTEKSVSLAGNLINKNYDVFATYATGVVSIELLAWTNDSTRATAITTQDGVKVKTGDVTRRLLGTIRTTSTNTSEDSTSKRFVWNLSNRLTRVMSATDATAFWTYVNPNQVWRQARGQVTLPNKFEFVCGDSIEANATVFSLGQTSTGTSAISVGVGLDSTTVNSATAFVGYGTVAALPTPLSAFFKNYVNAGYHALHWLETGQSNAVTYSFYGNNSLTMIQSGMVGSVSG